MDNHDQNKIKGGGKRRRIKKLLIRALTKSPGVSTSGLSFSGAGLRPAPVRTLKYFTGLRPAPARTLKYFTGLRPAPARTLKYFTGLRPARARCAQTLMSLVATLTHAAYQHFHLLRHISSGKFDGRNGDIFKTYRSTACVANEVNMIVMMLSTRTIVFA